MKLNSFLTKVSFALAIVSSTPCFAQVENKETILAKWKFGKFDFLQPVNDSLEMQNQFKELILTFGRDSLAITRRKAGEADEHVKSGPYRLSEDGRSLFLGDESAEILTLNSTQLLVKVKNHYILHLIKVDSSK